MKLTAMQKHEIERYYRTIDEQPEIFKDPQKTALFNLLGIMGIEWVFTQHGIKVKSQGEDR